jgi:hypothetical protein
MGILEQLGPKPTVKSIAHTTFEQRPAHSGRFFELHAPTGGLTALRNHIHSVFHMLLQKTPALRTLEKEKREKSKTAIDFEDPRVRSWTEKELADVATHIKAREMFSTMQVCCSCNAGNLESTRI